MSSDIQPPIDLPVWRLVKVSLASVFRHLGNFFGRAWPWVAIVAIATAIMGLGFDMTFEKDSPASDVIDLLLLIGPTMIVVSWHRGLLLGESGGPTTAFRFDRPFWRYVGIAIVATLLALACIGLPIYAISNLLSVIAAPQKVAQVVTGIGAIIIVVVCLPFLSRFLLALPMAAIGAEPPILPCAWRLGEGNGWYLFGGFFLLSWVSAAIQRGVLLPIYIAYGISTRADPAAAINGATANLFIQPMLAALTMLSAALLASYASYAYAVLTNHPLGRDVTGP